MNLVSDILNNLQKYSVQELIQGVQSGLIPSFVGIPLIEERNKLQQRAQAGAQGQQPKQPPIAQQVLAQAERQTQPQPQGIPSLPTNLPTQTMAGGGIVAFAGGGDPLGQTIRQQAANVDAERFPDYEDYVRRTGKEEDEAQAEVDRQRRQQAYRAMLWPERFAPPTPDYPIPEINVASPATSATAPTAPTQPGVAALQQPPQPGQAPTQPGIAGLGGGVDFNKWMKLAQKLKPEYTAPAMPTVPNVTEVAKEQTRNMAKESDARWAEVEKKIEANKVPGEAYTELKASLQKEAEQAGAEKETARGMAIFKAGLAMMAGTSPNAFENIGRGAMVGAEDYQAAVKDLKKAEKDRQHMFALIEQARRAESRDDMKTRNEFIMKAAEHKDVLTNNVANAIISATKTDAESARHMATSIIAAGAQKYHADVAGIFGMIGHGMQAEATLGAAATRAGVDKDFMNQTARAKVYEDISKRNRTPEVMMDVQSSVAAKRGIPLGNVGKMKGPAKDTFDAEVEQELERRISAEYTRATSIPRAGGQAQPLAGNTPAAGTTPGFSVVRSYNTTP